MMIEFTHVIDAISNVGIPIVLAVVFGYLTWHLGKKINDTAEENMRTLQARCLEREDKLYEEIKECHAINDKAIETIAHYAEKLDAIQVDVKEIKSDITFILAGGHRNDTERETR